MTLTPRCVQASTFGVGDLDAVAAAAALALAQVREQLAVAAAEVEHARAGRHQLGDQLDVLAIAHATLGLGRDVGRSTRAAPPW